MQSVSNGDNLHKIQNLSWKIKKNVMSWSSAAFALRVVKV